MNAHLTTRKKQTVHGKGAMVADLERAVTYFTQQLERAEVTRSKANPKDTELLDELDRIQELRRKSLALVQAELDRVRQGEMEPTHV